MPYNTKQQWGKNGLDNSNWGSSQVKNYLNSTFLSSISTYWNSMISQHGWYIKDQTSSSGYAEPKDGQIISGDANNRIGLMYLTDYNIAGNWILIKNSWNSNTAIEEWTMTRYGYDDEMAWWYAWAVNSYGTLQYRYVGTEDAVRPVFYLQSNVNLTGEGTKDHPYIITTMNNA